MTALPAHHRSDAGKVDAFLRALRHVGFSGEIDAGEGVRTVYATDNSIYQLFPAAVILPRSAEDLSRAVTAAREAGIALTPRGGGTGTNGQSLTGGVVVDLARHMNQILFFDPDSLTVTVEPGVVLDQLNAFLKPHGLFFPPTVSTASRATIGGMVATDASGKGSRIYGKTSDYVSAMDVVLSDGTRFHVTPLDAEARSTLIEAGGIAGAIVETSHRLMREHRDLIDKTFPDMNRGLTGYNLRQALREDDRLDLTRLLAGSEGTLALTAAITLRVVPRPACRALMAVRYDSFAAALGDVGRLLTLEPAAIEILDDKVLALAEQDILWTEIERLLGGATTAPVRGLNIVEFIADDAVSLAARCDAAAALLDQPQPALLDVRRIDAPADIAAIWELRKKSVGLLGRLGGSRQAIPFVEDTAVPPERLVDYVRDFRAILDRHQLVYGMFGHADVGCLHVRPALDMRDPADAALIRSISDEVHTLTRQYGGLIWGEHGKGFRGDYAPDVFGALYPVVRALKTVFDPENRFNPGKIATPEGAETALPDRIDGIPLRGTLDAMIEGPLRESMAKAVSCNGNGACQSWAADEAMCPSFKATGDKAQSPKGRAALLREWARRQSTGEAQVAAFKESVKASLSTCLSCKACASQCPVKVDIPAMKSVFLDHYYSSRRRPLRDRVVAGMEPLLAVARAVPKLANLALDNPVSRRLLARIGLCDLPALSTLPRLAHREPTAAAIAALPDPARALILLEDSFTASFDRAVPQAIADLLTRLGFTVFVAPPLQNGKALHVTGQRSAFAETARAADRRLAALARLGLPLVGAETVPALLVGDEYAAALGRPLPAAILGVEQFLQAALASGLLLPPTLRAVGERYTLIAHCTEKTARPDSPKAWASVFAAFGLTLATPAAGCCGMAGLFGHETEHKPMSETLFRMSWAPILARESAETVLATGFSCRCQTKRFAGFRPRHPAEALLAHLVQEGH